MERTPAPQGSMGRGGTKGGESPLSLLLHPAALLPAAKRDTTKRVKPTQMRPSEGNSRREDRQGKAGSSAGVKGGQGTQCDHLEEESEQQPWGQKWWHLQALAVG